MAKVGKTLGVLLVVVLFGAGAAFADNFRTVESERVHTKKLVVGGKVVDPKGEGALAVVPDSETIASGGTITANACGGIKRIDSGSAVTTDTTNTFTAPAEENRGCVMYVCNTNASDAITLDDNANAELSGIAGGTPGNTALGAADCVTVGSDGSVWRQLGPGSQN